MKAGDEVNVKYIGYHVQARLVRKLRHGWWCVEELEPTVGARYHAAEEYITPCGAPLAEDPLARIFQALQGVR